MKFEVFVKIPYMGQIRTAITLYENGEVQFHKSNPDFNFLASEVMFGNRLPITCSEVVDIDTLNKFATENYKPILDEVISIVKSKSFLIKNVEFFNFTSDELRTLYFSFNPGEGAKYVPARISIYRIE